MSSAARPIKMMRIKEVRCLSLRGFAVLCALCLAAFVSAPAVRAQDDFDFDALLDDLAEVPPEEPAEEQPPSEAPSPPVETEPPSDLELDSLLGEVDELVNGEEEPAAEDETLEEFLGEMEDAAPDEAPFPPPTEEPPVAEEEPSLEELLGPDEAVAEETQPEPAPAPERPPEFEPESEDLEDFLMGLDEEPPAPEPEVEEVEKPEPPGAPAADVVETEPEEAAPAEDDLFEELFGEAEEPPPPEEPEPAAVAEPPVEELPVPVEEEEPEIVEAEPEEPEEEFDFEDLMAEEVPMGEEPPPAEIVDEMPEEEPPPPAEAPEAPEGVAEVPEEERREPTAAEAELADRLGIELEEAARLIAQQEEIRLQAQEVEALKALDEGYRLLSEKKYSPAVNAFEQALEMPVRPQNEEERERAKWGYAEANYMLARNLYRERRDLETAMDYLERGLAQLPTHRASQRLQPKVEKLIERPETLPVKKRPEFQEKQDTIANLLSEGKQYYKVRDYDRAEMMFERVLAEDPYHVDAMRFLKKIGELRFDIRTKEYEATASDMIQEVRKTWNPPERAVDELAPGVGMAQPVPRDTPSERLEQKLREIVIPSLELREMVVADVVDLLVEASIAGDPEGVGVNIIYNEGRRQRRETGPGAAPAEPGDDFFEDEFGFFEGERAAPSPERARPAGRQTTITLSLRRVSLLDAIRYITEVSGLKHRIEENVVIITPADVVTGQIITRMYPVQPGVLDGIIARQQPTEDTGPGFGEFGTFGTGPTAEGQENAIKEFFIKAGVPFDPPTDITYNPAISKLIVANTPENHDRLQRVLDEINLTPRQVEIEARFVEIAQDDLEELGLEWLLTDDFEIATKDEPGLAGGKETIQINENADLGGFTRGIRFFNFDNTSGSVVPSSAGEPGGTLTPFGNILSASAILTNPEVTVILHALEQSGRADLLSAPRVTARVGQPAEIRVVQEIIYPTEFEQDITVIEGGETPDRQVVTVTPGAFETRPIGVLLNVTPQVAPDGFTIDLAIAPQVAELLDWLNFGSVFEGQEISILQPIFAFRDVNTTISIWDGQTVVMGGLIREDIISFNDRIPIIGDIPFLGRFFRNEGERSSKRNLIIFVTARLVRPDGRPLNTAEELARQTGAAPAPEQLSP